MSRSVTPRMRARFDSALNLRLDARWLAWIDTKAAAEGVSASAYIRGMIVRAIRAAGDDHVLTAPVYASAPREEDDSDFSLYPSPEPKDAGESVLEMLRRLESQTAKKEAKDGR